MSGSDVDFQATQDFLGVFSADELWEDLVSVPPPAAAAAAAEATAQSFDSKRARRITPKQQICQLQGEVRRLSMKLEALGADRTQCNRHTLCHRPGLWHQIAARQLERRRNSESENHKLRNMVKLQAEEAKNLCRILRRRTKIQRLQKMLEINLHNKQESTQPLVVVVEKEEQAFEGMLRDVSDICDKMDALFMEKEMHSIPYLGRKRRADNSMINGLCFELTKRDIVPFSVESVKDAVWSSLGQLELEGLRSIGRFKTDVQFRKQDSDRDTTTVMASFFTAFSNSNTSGVKTRKVVRRYDEESRTVFIYRAFMEPNPYEFGESFGVHATSTLVIEIRHTDLDDEATLIQSHFSVTRHDEGLAAGHPLRVAVSLNTAITVWDETISRIHDGVENRLMDRARQSLDNELATVR
ncbi:hypothetical protein PC129_g15840 [Phytophthora cactorum]|uniref:M96 mating-specific protein family n=1 Tax=Phytophthora cactorum TaxID=29920 RepID=A0A329RKS4_9STRA|nr:hypothetical protein Pcac1_g20089 [Phytophthora cactorum]KAG2800792.1 hypothetical protein PC112_g20320 [Phytophthora cactorum]KAG2801322.1 hypothetical protein PC111_g19590 [Phytophthora cactorum]KAG2835593.1 hypothetical protein PC113_g20185 [Phytophthora cactorum]KAG2880077.1 hypothetical protein PC114_g22246 [Phytophthora cactorum]